MKRVLAIDDTHYMLAMLSECLQEAGHSVVTAQDGVEGLAQLREHRPDMVITDLNMPNMDGLQFVRAARRDPAGIDLPILLLTTETAQNLRDEAARAHATGWLCKPFEPDQILRLVEQLA
ncbi:response regulator [Pontivivens insulae]|uniref:Chemotaxis protein CheY n=1 Tax=Pontivivens insulae TaxID=1639689 RepID=A0A2R8A6J0_9RHOB|nr:response regulator [Pontivivens insulae]RED17972.1 two-component system chemotaxis response regulator CheY [Pontivivens insulae]SPF27861.1 Chemotaxis protein CheY [Pontivivens insulae]